MHPDSAPSSPEAPVWTAFRARRFEQARRVADEAAAAADDPAVRARLLVAGARLRHAAGDLDSAERLFAEALALTDEPERARAGAWLGVLRAHQGRLDEALNLLLTATRDHAAADAEALLYAAYTYALAGRPAAALDTLARCADSPDKGPGFAAHLTNLTGWVLRSAGAIDEGRQRHHAALEVAGRTGADEVAIAALQDIAEDALERGDVRQAWRRLEEAESSLMGDLAFGWRLAMRLRLLQGRVALARGDAESAATYARVLAARADAAGVPRYAVFARLLGHRARAALGEPVPAERVEADLDELDRYAAPECWWWTAMLGAELRVPSWLDRGAGRMAVLAGHAGEYGPALRAWATPRLDAWRSAS